MWRCLMLVCWCEVEVRIGVCCADITHSSMQLLSLRKCLLTSSTVIAESFCKSHLVYVSPQVMILLRELCKTHFFGAVQIGSNGAPRLPLFSHGPGPRALLVMTNLSTKTWKRRGTMRMKISTTTWKYTSSSTPASAKAGTKVSCPADV